MYSKTLVLGLIFLMQVTASAEEFSNSLGMKFVYCKPGRFRMGSPPSDKDANPLGFEKQVNVDLTKGFFLGKFEVTQSEWRLVMNTEPWNQLTNRSPRSRNEVLSPEPSKGRAGTREGASYPATHISWDDAVAFCKRLSEKEGKVYRLPTEAQWEYACRAGSTTRYSFGDDSSKLGTYEWWRGNLNGKDYEHVGKKRPNAWGLHDMHGNATEWCADYYSIHVKGGRDPFVNVRPRNNPSGIRVSRGGKHSPEFCRSACRDGVAADHRHLGGGFRVVLEGRPAKSAKQ